MKVEFEVASGKEALQKLVASLFGEEDTHGERCRCLECTADRMSEETYSDARPSDEDMVVILQRRMLAVAKEAQDIEQRTQEMCAAMIEKPKRAEADNAMLYMRVEEFNARVRCIRTLWHMLPEEHQASLPAGVVLPEFVTWEKALADRESMRREVNEAVATRKESRGVGPELAELLKAALKRGRSREAVAELLQTAADSVRAPRPEEPSPPPAA